MTWPRALPWIALLLLAGFVLGDVQVPSWLGGSGEPALAAGGSAAARLERVIDGDTIVVQVGGREERVRYIGVDTPETVKPNTPVQCFGERAHDLNTRLLGAAGSSLQLRFDRELRDRYGRLLAYVYRAQDGLFVNARLVDAGAARTLTIAPNTAHAAQLSDLQHTARAAGRGLWTAC
ncbi:MAG TPA: thermonuclease family protein [Conexibacter sp.]|jgi:micrococcal nuclease|nr:thermonuclease family protein [Conexibacter sp.]